LTGWLCPWYNGLIGGEICHRLEIYNYESVTRLIGRVVLKGIGLYTMLVRIVVKSGGYSYGLGRRGYSVFANLVPCRGLILMLRVSIGGLIIGSGKVV